MTLHDDIIGMNILLNFFGQLIWTPMSWAKSLEKFCCESANWHSNPDNQVMMDYVWSMEENGPVIGFQHGMERLDIYWLEHSIMSSNSLAFTKVTMHSHTQTYIYNAIHIWLIHIYELNIYISNITRGIWVRTAENISMLNWDWSLSYSKYICNTEQIVSHQ